jgi:CDP-glucose 4,6-dehydratase
MRLGAKFPYETSKACADMIAQSYSASYDLPLAIVRCGNVFGGGDLNWSRLVPGSIRSFSQGNSPEIRSDGTYVRDYVYVKDVVSAYLTVAEHLDAEEVRGEAFNFGSETPVTALEMVELIRGLMHADGIEPIVQGIATGEIHSQYLSTEKARRVLGWSSRYTLEQGLATASTDD